MGSIPGLGRSPGGGMATHSSILAWRIPQTEEPGGLQSTGLWSWIQLSNSTHAGSTLLKGFEPRPWNVYQGPEGAREPQLSLTWKLVYVSQAPGGIWFSSLQWNKELATPTSVLTPEVPKSSLRPFWTGKGVEEVGSSLIKNSIPSTIPAPPSLRHTFHHVVSPAPTLSPWARQSQNTCYLEAMITMLPYCYYNNLLLWGWCVWNWHFHRSQRSRYDQVHMMQLTVMRDIYKLRRPIKPQPWPSSDPWSPCRIPAPCCVLSPPPSLSPAPLLRATISPASGTTFWRGCKIYTVYFIKQIILLKTNRLSL